MKLHFRSFSGTSRLFVIALWDRPWAVIILVLAVYKTDPPPADT